jgi:hypothetical protein
VRVDDAWLQGFAACLLSIWQLHHDGQMVRHIINANGITLGSLRDSGIDEDHYDALVKACFPK